MYTNKETGHTHYTYTTDGKYSTCFTASGSVVWSAILLYEVSNWTNPDDGIQRHVVVNGEGFDCGETCELDKVRVLGFNNLTDLGAVTKDNWRSALRMSQPCGRATIISFGDRNNCIIQCATFQYYFVMLPRSDVGIKLCEVTFI